MRKAAFTIARRGKAGLALCHARRLTARAPLSVGQFGIAAVNISRLMLHGRQLNGDNILPACLQSNSKSFQVMLKRISRT
jgi:hypothetical protein